MTAEDELRVYESVLAAALSASDPVAALAAASEDSAHPAWLRRALAAVDANGVRMSRLLVARLRFERLLRGSDRASDWFERDAPAFTAAFRRYHAQVPPTGAFAQSEAATFHAWLAADRSAPPD